MVEKQLVIRPARSQDQAAVLAFTDKIWNGEDYIDEVWDEWLVDPNGPLLIGEVAGEPVALIKFSDLGDGESWIHGLRVAEEARKQGIGRAMLERCMELAREREDEIVRMMTGEENHIMQSIAEQAGFKLAVKARWYTGQPTEETFSLVPLDEFHHDWLNEQVASSKLLASTNQLYSFNWRYMEMTPSRLREHLRAGQIFSMPGSDAWAIMDVEENWLSIAEGPESEVLHLLHTLLAHPALYEKDEIYALVPENTQLANVLVRAGFEADEHYERCYEWRPNSK